MGTGDFLGRRMINAQRSSFNVRHSTSLMPEVPACQGLKMKHLESVLYCGPLLGSTAHEGSLEWIVHEVVEQVVCSHGFVG